MENEQSNSFSKQLAIQVGPNLVRSLSLTAEEYYVHRIEHVVAVNPLTPRWLIPSDCPCRYVQSTPVRSWIDEPDFSIYLVTHGPHNSIVSLFTAFLFSFIRPHSQRYAACLDPAVSSESRISDSKSFEPLFRPVAQFSKV